LQKLVPVLIINKKLGFYLFLKSWFLLYFFEKLVPFFYIHKNKKLVPFLDIYKKLGLFPILVKNKKLGSGDYAWHPSITIKISFNYNFYPLPPVVGKTYMLENPTCRKNLHVGKTYVVKSYMLEKPTCCKMQLWGNPTLHNAAVV